MSRTSSVLSARSSEDSLRSKASTSAMLQSMTSDLSNSQYASMVLPRQPAGGYTTPTDGPSRNSRYRIPPSRVVQSPLMYTPQGRLSTLKDYVRREYPNPNVERAKERRIPGLNRVPSAPQLPYLSNPYERVPQPRESPSVPNLRNTWASDSRPATRILSAASITPHSTTPANLRSIPNSRRGSMAPPFVDVGPRARYPLSKQTSDQSLVGLAAIFERQSLERTPQASRASSSASAFAGSATRQHTAVPYAEGHTTSNATTRSNLDLYRSPPRPASQAANVAWVTPNAAAIRTTDSAHSRPSLQARQPHHMTQASQQREPVRRRHRFRNWFLRQINRPRRR